MTDTVRIDADSKPLQNSVNAATKSIDDLFDAVSKLSSQGGSSFEAFSKRGAAAAKLIGDKFHKDVKSGIEAASGSAENSANFFSATAKRIAKEHESSVMEMLDQNKTFTLSYFQTWKDLGRSVPGVIKPIYTGLLRDQKEAVTATLNFQKAMATNSDIMVAKFKENEAAKAVASLNLQKAMATNSDIMVAKFKENETAKAVASLNLQKAMAANGDVMVAKFKENEAAKAVASTNLQKAMAANGDVMAAKFKENEAAKAIAALNLQKAMAANGDVMAAKFKENEAAKAAATELTLTRISNASTQMWAGKAKGDKEAAAATLNLQKAMAANGDVMVAKFRENEAAKAKANLSLQKAMAANSDVMVAKFKEHEAAKRAEMKATADRAAALLRDEMATATMVGNYKREQLRLYNEQLNSNMSAEAAKFRQLSANQQGPVGLSSAQGKLGATSLIVPSFTTPTSEAKGFTGALKHLRNEFRAATIDGNDLHSAMRGLASGFNLLWLTWGNLAPLFAGAVISFGTKAVIEMGAQVEHTFETIKTLTGATTESIKGLNEQMHAIAQSGPVGPMAVADAMKTLALAGLKAGEVSAAIKDVLNFSVAGDVDIKKAADVMTTVATAFSVSANAYNMVGDAIAKTAAVSKSSVEDIGEAFKTASVINKQYGASLTDVGVGLAALANLGIRGSAAGTALRNMYADLSGRTNNVAKVLEKYKLDLRDGEGNFKDVVTIAKELDATLSKLQGKSEKDFLRSVFSERGGKVIVELLDLVRQKAEETGTTVASKLDEMRQEIEDRAGFAIISAAKLSLTPLNQMKSVVATMQSELIKAFDAVAPAIVTVSQNLKDMFRSPEFQTGLQNMILAFGKLAMFIGRNIGVIAELAAAFAVFKVTQFAHNIGVVAVGALQSFITYAKAVEAQAILSTTAVSAFSNAMVFLGGVAAKVLPWLARFNIVLTVATMFYAAYEAISLFKSKHDSLKTDAAGSTHKAYVEALKEETARLNEQTEALRQNMTVEELRAKKKATISIAEADAKIKTAEAALKAATEKQSGSSKGKMAVTGNALKRLEKAVEDAKKERNALAVAMADRNAALSVEEEAAKAAAKANAEEEEKKWKERTKKHGNGTFMSPEDAARLAKEAKAATHQEIQMEMDKLKELSKIYKDGEALSEKLYAKELRALDSKHKNGIISEAEYQSTLAKLAAEHEARIGETEISTELEAAKEYLKLEAKINASTSLTKEEKANLVNKLKVAYDELIRTMDNNTVERQAAALLKLEEAANDATGRVNVLDKAVNKFLVEDENALAAGAREVGEAFDKYTAAGMEAAAKQAEKYANEVAKVAVEMELLKAQLEAISDPEMKQKFEDNIKRLEALRDKLNKRSVESQATAYKNAVDKLKDADFRKFTSKIADAIIKGGVNAGPDLRSILEDEFLKEPFKVLIEAAVSDVSTGGLSKMLGPDGATFKQLVKVGSQLKGAYDFVTGTSASSWLAKDGFAAGVGGMAKEAGFSLMTLAGKVSNTFPKLADALARTANFTIDNAATIGEYAQIAGNTLSYINALDAASQGKWGRAIGQAYGTSIAGPIGGAIGGAIGGWVDDAFGGGTESSLGVGITGTFGANSVFTGQRFDRRRNSGQSGLLGIGGTSAREWDNLSALDTGVSDSLSVQFFMLKAQTAAFATSLGLSTKTIADYTRAMRLSLSTDTAANQKAIADFFTTMADEMASTVLDKKYRKEGESAADALARLSTNLVAVNGAFELMGKGKFASSLAGGSSADALITIFGGKDKFDSAQSSFYNAFYSDAEKQANLQKSLESSFATLGKAMPASRDAFRQMVLAQDVTTDSGRQTYAQLLSLSEAFDSLTNTAKKATESVSETDFATQVAYLRFKGRLGLGTSVEGLSKVSGFASGGVHSGGWRVVGENGPELENTGPSRIYSNSDSLFDVSAIVNELQALRTEVSYLRADAKATASNTNKAAKLYDKWDADGMPEVRA